MTARGRTNLFSGFFFGAFAVAALLVAPLSAAAGAYDGQWLGLFEASEGKGCGRGRTTTSIPVSASVSGKNAELKVGGFSFQGAIKDDGSIALSTTLRIGKPAYVNGRFSNASFDGDFFVDTGKKCAGKIHAARQDAPDTQARAKAGHAKAGPATSSQRVQLSANTRGASSTPAPRDLLQSELATLKKLRADGLITPEQFTAKQQALLDRAFGGPAQTARATPTATPKAGSAKKPVLPAGIRFGDYHALVIGINKYAHLTNLVTAENDAKSMAGLLNEQYGFNVTLLLNPTRAEIIDALDDLRATLKFKDNLLIYYAGHGWLDEQADQGFWLPADAKPDRRSAWVSNDIITGTLKAVEAKHVMVVADSCYSGRLVRGAKISIGDPDYLKKISRKKARVVITSGGLEPVADSGGDDHSPFTSAFLKALSENNGVLDGNSLFNKIRRPVMVSADQTPQFSDIRKAGHDGGDFLFVRTN